MSKKITALLLSTTMFFGSMIGVSAKNNEVITNATTSIQTLEDNIIEDHYTTFYPGQKLFDGVSVSVSERSYSAYREASGDVILTINETMNTTDCYYRFHATDQEGINFTPDKDLQFYIEATGIHTVRLPASSISRDGYVYLYFAVNPNKDPGTMFCKQEFRVPVDYEENKVVTEDYISVQPNQDYRITGTNGQYMDFTATATRRTNGNVLLQMNVKGTNANPSLEHNATSRKGDVYLRHNFNTYQTNGAKPLSISLYKYNVSYEGDIYFTIWFTSSTGTKYVVEQIKIPVQ